MAKRIVARTACLFGDQFLSFKGDFLRYNPKSDLCSTLQPGDYVCCSAGDPYTEPKPQAPQPDADGSCAVHFIRNFDICASLGKAYGLTEAQIESFNKGKTWGWTECRAMLAGYNISTCVSNSGNEIKQNSGPPANFSRIGYYESWNIDRKCLWMKAENANTDRSYTHIHWGFAKIDPATWTVVLKDPITNSRLSKTYKPATYNMIRQAIITNREKFATNAAKFMMDEGLDGINIEWEYTGTDTCWDLQAPDIEVNGVPIGQPEDGVSYLRFLTVLKSKLPTKSVSIAAPASYWYLKAFPIDRIAAVIDYIVYMTYDLHGQWDYGNPNAFDFCPSGACIKSHVNLTETYNILVLVGESSYGRSFRIAINGHYISYMIPTTKETRRAAWRRRNFADLDKYNDLDKWTCNLWKYPRYRDSEETLDACIDAVEQAKEQGRTTNYSCVGHFPLDQEIPWSIWPGASAPDMLFVPGKRVCDNTLVNFLPTPSSKPYPLLPRSGVMRSCRHSNTITTAAQMLSYAYPPDQDPIGAFEWWLSPCGGTDLVPDEVKRVFEVLSTVVDGVSSFKKPPNIPRGSGRKGDDANPTNRSKPKAGNGSGPNGWTVAEFEKFDAVPPHLREESEQKAPHSKVTTQQVRVPVDVKLY
ncbi:hypothetical protein VTI74DRAFT_10423 [Chaetomium olivicolor]